jgi:hypothetical protein
MTVNRVVAADAKRSIHVRRQQSFTLTMAHHLRRLKQNFPRPKLNLSSNTYQQTM